MNKPKLGIQLYSVRKELNDDFKGTVKALAEMGFQGVELASDYGDLEPEELAALMEEVGLQVVGACQAFGNYCDAGARVYEYAEALEVNHLSGGFSLQALQGDFEGCLTKIRKACTVAESKQLTLCYHAHVNDYQYIGDKRIIEKLLTEVEALNFEADTAFIKASGIEVVDYLQKYADRIPVIHLKDILEGGSDTESGRGVVGAKNVMCWAKAEQLEWVIYEQESGDLTPLESAAISLDYLKNILKEEAER